MHFMSTVIVCVHSFVTKSFYYFNCVNAFLVLQSNSLIDYTLNIFKIYWLILFTLNTACAWVPPDPADQILQRSTGPVAFIHIIIESD